MIAATSTWIVLALSGWPAVLVLHGFLVVFLFTTLHEGSDKSGAVVGSGVLTLGMLDLAELLSTVRVTGTEAPLEIAATVTKFGSFFLGELWDTYGPRLLRTLGAPGQD